MEHAQGLSFEQQLLTELREVNERIGEIQQDQKSLKVELLGREGAEEHGRMTKVENIAEDHEERIKRLEKAYFVAGIVVGSMGMKVLAPLVEALTSVLKVH